MGYRVSRGRLAGSLESWSTILRRQMILLLTVVLWFSPVVRAQSVSDDSTGAELVRVAMITSEGQIVIGIDTVRAPITSTNFLRYADSGFYDGGSIFRTVREDNQPEDSIRIAVIQGAANPSFRDSFFPPIPLERTSVTGLMHGDGTISMARGAPDTATHSFFICIDDQPELDYGGHRNPDGQGFAAFGHVLSGMDIVRRIQALSAHKQTLDPSVTIQSVSRIK